MMSDPRRIFISYRRDDSSLATSWLYEQLTSKFGQQSVYKDIDSLRPGDDFVDSIARAITSSDVVIAVIGPRWDEVRDDGGQRRIDDPSDFVRQEIETALSQRRLVIPVLVDGATMPDQRSLPPTLEPLARRHAIQLTSTQFRRDTKDLIEFIRRELSSDSWWGRLRRRLQGVVLALQAAWRRKLLILGVGLALAVLIGGVFLIRWISNRPTEASVALPQSATALPDDVLVWRRLAGPADEAASYRIDLINLDGAKVRTLVSNRRNRAAVLTPDRRTVLYVRDANDDPKVDDWQLRAMGADGQGDRLLFRGSDVGCPIIKRPAIRADNRLAVVCKQSEAGFATLTLREVDGTVVEELDNEGFLEDPTFSQDGKSVVYWRADNLSKTIGGSLYRVKASGSKPVRVTSGTDGIDAYPAMSPTDNRLVFAHRVSDTEQRIILLDSLKSGASARQLTSGANDSSMSWSPDGQRIAFLRERNGRSEVLILDPASGAVETVVATGADYAGPPVWTAR